MATDVSLPTQSGQATSCKLTTCHAFNSSMHTDLPAQALAAVATVVASLIAAAVAFVNLTLTKELTTSEFRQAWIDALREDLAKFLGAARAFA